MYLHNMQASGEPNHRGWSPHSHMQQPATVRNVITATGLGDDGSATSQWPVHISTIDQTSKQFGPNTTGERIFDETFAGLPERPKRVTGYLHSSHNGQASRGVSEVLSWPQTRERMGQEKMQERDSYEQELKYCLAAHRNEQAALIGKR